MKSRVFTQILFPIIILILAACVPSGQLSLPSSAFTSTPVTPTLALTTTPTNTQTPTPLLTSTLLPSPTSTPRVHTIKAGETLLGIAWFYNVSLDELKSLNPDVNPNIMIVGTDLVIPVSTLPPTNLTPEPTPVQLPLEGLNCLMDSDEGAWCFVWVNNSSSESFENVTVNFNLADMQASQVIARQATSPLNLLLAGEKKPLAIYFPPVVPMPYQKSAQFNSAIPYNPESGRYLSVKVNVTSENSGLDGQLLTISGTFSTEEPVSSVIIVAVAVDDQENIIGLRRWQSSLSQPSDQGDFQLELAAVSGSISEYILFSEAQP